MEKYLILLLVCWTIKSESNTMQVTPGQPRMPFQYWLRLPIANNSGSVKNVGKSHFLGEPLIASANSINPKGFDFMKLLKVKRARVEKYIPVVPLLWLDLPLFDTPTFGDFPVKKNFSQRGEAVIIVKRKDKEPKEVERQRDDKSLKNNVNSLGKRDQLNIATNSIRNNTNSPTNNTNKFVQGSQNHDWSSSLKIPSKGRTRGNKNEDPLVSESRNQVTHRNIPISPRRMPEVIKTQPKSIPLLNPKPLAQQKVQPRQAESDPSVPKYNFSYQVSDPITKDMKSHKESRLGDLVQGEYSVLEPDGYTRVVTYTADSGGFRAIVKRIPPASNK